MEKDLTHRIDALEQEVRMLRAELNGLKNSQSVQPGSQQNLEKSEPFLAKQSEPVKPIQQPETIAAPREKEKPLTRFFFPEEARAHREAAQQPTSGKLAIQTPVTAQSFTQQPITEEKPNQTFEESITRALPKVFMVILVLGVLWGLKLVSDYGFLSDTVKVVMTYLLSIGLAVGAYLTEKKEKASPVVVITLYGGAFIVGILTTAAGAIIYEVLGLYVALMIALLYIAYGIGISYVKRNEVLTSFVAFTSLLLPYLLEYMDFNGLIIVGFVLLLMTVLQFVIIRHHQRIALYVTTFFALLAVMVVTTDVDRILFAISFILVLALYLFSWWRIYDQASTFKAVHEGLLFSGSAFTLLLINFTMEGEPYVEWVLVLTMLLFAAAAWYGWKQGARNVFDVVGTLALLTLVNIVITLGVSLETENLLLALSAFAGLMIALKLRVGFMKVTYSFVFLMVTVMIFFTNGVEPFFTIGNATLLLLLALMIGAFVYAKRPKADLTTFEKQMAELQLLDFIPAMIAAFVFLYIYRLDSAYLASNSLPYCTLIILALAMALSITKPSKTIGNFLPVFLIAGYFYGMAILSFTHTYNPTDDLFNIGTRLLYIAILVAILVDLYMEGSIFENWQKQLSKITEKLLITGLVLTVLLVMSLFTQLRVADYVSWEVSVIFKTMAIFIAASLALMFGSKRPYRSLKITGFVLLIFGLFKLIFLDLASLDLLIRSVLFMIIGGVGLLLSNRLLRK